MIQNTTLFPISSPHKIITPFVKASFGEENFGLTDKINRMTGVMYSDFITSLDIRKYGSGAVNTYTLNLQYVITPESDPNYIDLVLSRASNGRNISFTYGDLSQPEYSYKNEQGIITDVKPKVNYKTNTITYTITATSSTTLNYSQKRSFIGTVDQPSNVLLSTIYNHPEYGLLELLPGMLNRDEVISKGWIPRNDKVVKISEKIDIAPIDYILYLVSLMVGGNGEYYFLKVMDQLNENTLPHFEIVNTSRKDKSQMLYLTVGYPGSIPIYDFDVTENTSMALIADYQNKIEKGIIQDYNFKGDLITKPYYNSQTINGSYSNNLKNWWNRMTSFPITASLTTDGLYVPAEIVQSIYIDTFFFGKRYTHSGEYLILGQSDSISASGYRTKLDLMRIGGDNV